MNNEKDPTPPRRILWAILLIPRLPIGVLLCVLLVLAYILEALGRAGGWLKDWCEDMNHSLAGIFNPQVWDLLEQWKRERDRFREQAQFWKGEAMRRQDSHEGTSL